jgi:FKBP-type peptidyl-prolyl cis-trans isomerase
LCPLGAGQVLKGIEQGVEGMCEGEKRRLTVPPALAYGSKGSGLYLELMH